MAEARKRALALLAKLRIGTDPARQVTSEVTVLDLIDGYGADLERRGVVNAKAAVSSLNRNLARLADARAVGLGRADFGREINAVTIVSVPLLPSPFEALPQRR